MLCKKQNHIVGCGATLANGIPNPFKHGNYDRAVKRGRLTSADSTLPLGQKNELRPPPTLRGRQLSEKVGLALRPKSSSHKNQEKEK